MSPGISPLVLFTKFHPDYGLLLKLHALPLAAYLYALFRAIAAGPVSPVSTGPLFPSLVACLALPISAIAWQTPTQRPEVHRYNVETCEMAANSATELFRGSSNNFPFLQANN